MQIMEDSTQGISIPLISAPRRPAINLFFNLFFLENVCLLGVMAALEEMESSSLLISACSP